MPVHAIVPVGVVAWHIPGTSRVPALFERGHYSTPVLTTGKA